MRGTFPFDCIVVTFPDAKSAESANEPLESILRKRLRRHYPSQTIRVVSTFDPFGARCGSGGGTLAALEFAKKDETVLVLHAGGDSSRCPTQMILGKAWTSLPCGFYRNPTIWLIDQLQRLYEQAKFPKGTLVVAATDCLVTFFEKGARDIHWKYEYNNESVVIGVAVPAEVTTAKNHGVYIMQEGIAKSKSLGIANPLDVWQKPTLEKLINTKEPAPSSFHLSHLQKEQAWIDTGVVVFLPRAVHALYELSGGILALCTRKGLEAAYEEQSPENESLEEFAKKNALKVDLYTDFLHNLSRPKQVTEGGKLEESPLQKVFSKLPLQILVAPQGRFLHLGTTQELVDFVTAGAYPDHSGIVAYLASHLSLSPRYQCWLDPQPLDHNVALHSTFPEEATIGTSSLVEYSDLASHQSVKIGDNVMLSGWRRSTDTAPLEIPSNLSVQQLSLKEANGTALFSYMVLGMTDGIKIERQHSTIYGVPLQDFLEKTGLSVNQFGWKEENNESDTLWTARIHPIVPAGTSFGSIFGWLKELRNSNVGSLSRDSSLLNWLSLRRVSLKELHSLANAAQEWTFRRDMELKVVRIQQKNFIPYLQVLLKERCCRRPCDLNWLVEMEDREVAEKELLEVLAFLEKIAREELEQEKYDICGRAFMIASAVLADFSLIAGEERNSQGGQEIIDHCMKRINVLRSSSTRQVSKEEQLKSLDSIAEHRTATMEKGIKDCHSAYSEISERLAFCMNELSIAGGFHKFVDGDTGGKIISGQDDPVVKNKWVMAMAPARCDLAGGWSDTPPICYEYGGSVTGMAVLVDGHMPLSCRCRIVAGKQGVLLRTDMRDSHDGSLKSFLESEITTTADLNDFRNPLAACALVKSAVVCLGMVSEEQIRSRVELQPLVNKFCSSSEDVRIEIVTTSLLPHGSGMGTSSILGGCVLAAIAKCVGIGELSHDYLFHAVLMLEQLLSSGGGYQDQGT